MPTDVSPRVSSRDGGGVGAACGCGAAFAELRARVAAIEHRLSPSTLRREDRAALERILPALAGSVGSACFLASEAVASDHPGVRLVLGSLTGRRLGRLLRRGEGVPVGGYVVHAQGMESGSILWAVLRVP
jgi:hypothetical protein